MDFVTFDLEAEANEGAWLHLVSPIDEMPLYDGKTPVRVKLLGRDSSAFKKEIQRIARLGKAAAKDIDKQRKRAIGLIAAVTVEWEGFNDGGKPIECNQKNVSDFYEKQAWAFEQADQFVDDRSNFFTEGASD